MAEALTVEGVGETVGEARWSALRELERRVPGLDRDRIAFQVLSEGERGLMGVGREPARVVATVEVAVTPTAEPATTRGVDTGGHDSRRGPGRRPAASPRVPEDLSDEAGRVREILTAVCSGVGLGASVHVARTDDGLVATLSGPELGLLIGRRGHTIDALQYLVNAMLNHATEERTSVTVDAQDYRRRRETALRETADRAADEALGSGAAVTLEPMSSVERKVLHLHLAGRADVVTESAGREPHRYVVVRPGDAPSP